MDYRHNKEYKNLQEGYCSPISLLGSLKGLERSFNKNSVCYCRESADERIKLPKHGACFYEQKCADCDINKSCG